MKGSIVERSPGHWAIILDQRDPATGKRKRKWHSFKGTKRQAEIECARLITAVAGGTYQEPNKVTLGDFLSRWTDHIKSQVSPKSHERYAGIVNQNIKPLLGAVLVTKLKPAQISEAYTKALAGGRRDDKEGGLAPRTVGHMHRVLKQALIQAVRWELIPRNPADAVDPPKVDWKPMQTYDLPQTAELIEAVRGTPIFIPALLAVLCGLRRGEICALRWRNVDLNACQLSVVESLEQTKPQHGAKPGTLEAQGLRFKSPKSGKGRTVALSETVVAELRTYRAQRAQEALKLGIGLPDDALVISPADGSIVQPIYISQQWARLIAKTSLARLRFHDLRHAHATHLLANGVHPKVASERLGHSKVGITLDLYSHVIPGMQEDAAATVDAALKAAQNQSGSNPVAGRIGRTEAE
ncbi:tyrosine-type recombinase/integrase [Bradyrhizobium elkanii]|uniref:tyrosine-type recombinase/integrase n=1 Tax=Bradyrhizobium elkanii TaxID=29448 RepID=UPI0014494303|nr:tyrosine-type recombinase/integrase [Bradyrhizobium elkanii]MCS3577654.1 integrase [Bradyrhizobium elkanii]MCS3720529.1 integrase [Bradyrhizobium elkanii]MCS4004946.1 integrase [Bradyrhizobium elkanii USDA 61]BBC00103.1 bacteriophage integrase [Bradyrhizobium elkanii USDA 61]